jgi:hypothetical protein
MIFRKEAGLDPISNFTDEEVVTVLHMELKKKKDLCGIQKSRLCVTSVLSPPTNRPMKKWSPYLHLAQESTVLHGVG